MTDLYASPVLHMEQRSSQLEYDITDDNDTLLGKATQVSGPKPRGGLLGMVAGSGLDGARLVLLVSGADGTPLFYVDHQDGAPVATVAPDGTVIGRMVYDQNAPLRRIVESGSLTGMGGVAGLALGLPRPPAMAHELLDHQDRPLARLDWEMRRRGTDENISWVPVGCAVSDLEGRQIAAMDVHNAVFKDRFTLRLLYQLPEPMRTLVIAAPLAFDLSRT